MSEFNEEFIRPSEFLSHFFNMTNEQIVKNFETLENWAILTYAEIEKIRNTDYFKEKMNDMIDLDNFSNQDLLSVANDVLKDLFSKNQALKHDTHNFLLDNNIKKQM